MLVPLKLDVIHTISRVYQHPSFTDLTTDLWTPWSHQQEQLSQTESCTPWPLILYTASTFCQMNKLEQNHVPPTGYISALIVICGISHYFHRHCVLFHLSIPAIESWNWRIWHTHWALHYTNNSSNGNPTVFSSTVVLKSTWGYSMLSSHSAAFSDIADMCYPTCMVHVTIPKRKQLARHFGV